MKTSLIFISIFISSFVFAAEGEVTDIPTVRSGQAFVCQGATPLYDPSSQVTTHTGYMLSYSVFNREIVADLTFANALNETNYETCLNADCSQRETVTGNFAWFGIRRLLSGRLRDMTPEERATVSEGAVTIREGLEKKPAGDTLRLYIWDMIKIDEMNAKAKRVQQALVTDRLNPDLEPGYERIMIYRDASNKVLGTVYLNQFTLIPTVCQ